MVMENPFEGKEIWFGVGSQDLYGEEALRQVAIHSAEMVDYLNNTGKIPAKIVILDPKPRIMTTGGGFTAALEELYPDIIQLFPNSKVKEVDPINNKSVTTAV